MTFTHKRAMLNSNFQNERRLRVKGQRVAFNFKPTHNPQKALHFLFFEFLFLTKFQLVIFLLKEKKAGKDV
jgi:hypothetical protein